MKAVERLKERITRNKYGKAFLEQYGFKTTVFAFVSLLITFVFAVFNGVFGVLDRSLWYGALAGYYVMLLVFRTAVLIADIICGRKFGRQSAEYAVVSNKIRLASGAFLVIIEIAMAAAVTQMILTEAPVRRGEIMAIATAVYAFYKLPTAIVHLVKAKRYGDPVAQSLRNLNFADACMSMASLTVLMIATFGSGDMNSASELTIKACVGFAACAVVLVTATVMIIISARELAREKRDGRRSQPE